MSNRKGIAALAACTALACAGLVRADDALVPQTPLSLAAQPLYAADAAPVPRRPLMYALEQAGAAKTLDNAGINIFGHVEASYTYGASSPLGNVITGRVFDVDHEDITLNQVDLTIQRLVDPTKGKVDVGFTVEGIYGGDARFIHSNGMNFYGSASPQPDPDEQLDLTQAYVDLAVPVGNGMLVRAGKFVTLMGFETINPTTNPLYSHSYLFGFAIPFTQTGIYAQYALSDKLSVIGGISRGWNQSLEDNNSNTIDGLGQVMYKVSDATTVTFNFTVGPEAAGDPGNWWYVGDFVLSQKVGDQLTVAVNADYGIYTHGDPTGNGKSAQWYGIAAYGMYTLNDMFSINSRAEWYDDQDGFTLGGGPNSLYEATLGVGIRPLPNDAIGKNLLIRPEVRFDYSDKAFFDGGTDHYGFSAAVDVIFTF